MRAVGLWGALLLAGCVVDVDLGRSMADPVEPDAAPPDARVDLVLLDAALDLDGPPDAMPDRPPLDPPDALPDLPPFEQSDAAVVEIETCDDCIALMTEMLDCPAEQPCFLDPVLAEICAAVCEVPDDGSCDGCFASIEPLIQACVDSAPIDVCRELEGALLLQCETRCADDTCGQCLDQVAVDCRAEAPFECTQSVVDAFGACFGVCDESVVFDGISCGIDAADAWTLCVHDLPAQCDGPLDAEVGVCRARAGSDIVSCMESCSALSAVRRESCASFGFDEGACAVRAQEGEVACIADCQGQLWGPCEPGARTRATLCERVEGPDCDALGNLIDFTCRAEFFGEGFCDDCLLQALVMAEGCGDVDGCITTLEDEWAFCLDQCGGNGPQPGCLDCALAADERLGDCVRGGQLLVQCLADREAAARGCAELCGDAIPRAVPCTTRSEALFGYCGLEPEPEACFERAALFDAACHWFRLSIE